MGNKGYTLSSRELQKKDTIISAGKVRIGGNAPGSYFFTIQTINERPCITK